MRRTILIVGCFGLAICVAVLHLPRRSEDWRGHLEVQKARAALRAMGVSESCVLPYEKKVGVVIDLSDTSVTNLLPLKGLLVSTMDLSRTKVTEIDLTVLRSMPVRHLSLSGTAVANLTPLEGMDIRRLDISRTLVTNLAPLRHIPRLCVLNLSGLQITDCSGLQDVRCGMVIMTNSTIRSLEPFSKLHGITHLDLSSSSISDLAPLASLPRLFGLDLSNAQVDNLTPLKDCRRLSTLSLPPAPTVTDLAVLKSMPLYAINGLSTYAFWQEYDATNKLLGPGAQGGSPRNSK